MYRDVLIVLLSLGCGAPVPAAPPAPAEAAAPTTEIVTGPELSARLTAPTEKLRLVNFWATWCPPCLAELPHLEAFAKRHPDIEVVLVNVDHRVIRDSRVKPTIEQRALHTVDHLFLDADDPAVALRENVPDWPDQIPVNLFIGEQGQIMARYERSLTAAEMESTAKRLIGGT